MKKIGFIDYFLDEWHANNYPKFIADECGNEFEVAYAYAEIDKPDGLTTDQWCEKFGVQRCLTISELVEKSDCIIVLSPDNPERHLDLCREPLSSGKPVYVDKTFAPSKEIAIEIVEIGERSKTPFCSSSALRFSDELKLIPKEGIKEVISRGPGHFDTYSIHQIEPIVVLMGSDVDSVVAPDTQKESILMSFKGGRKASMEHGSDDFSLTVKYENGETLEIPQMSNYFPNFIKALCQFFKDGKIFARHDETVAVMAIIESGNKALKTPNRVTEV